MASKRVAGPPRATPPPTPPGGGTARPPASTPATSPPSPSPSLGRPVSIGQHEREEEAVRSWEASGFPKRHRRACRCIRLDEGPFLDALNRVWAACVDPKGSIVAMLGDRGRGKTQAAALVAHRFAHELHRTVRYSRLADLFAAIKHDVYGGAGGSEATVLRSMSRIGLLVLDEVQERGETDWEDKMLARIIDHRYGEMVPTLLIANSTVQAFGDAVGASVRSRIMETGTIVSCEWGNYRQGATR